MKNENENRDLALELPSKTFWEALQEFRATADLEDLDVENTFANLRDPSPGREVDF